jgi:Cyclophilin type peptidyl-prolyl cis-trans isomerase/CLD
MLRLARPVDSTSSPNCFPAEDQSVEQSRVDIVIVQHVFRRRQAPLDRPTMVSLNQRERRRPKCSGWWQSIHVLVVLAGLAGIYIVATMFFLIAFNTTDTITGSSSVPLVTPPAVEDPLLSVRRIHRPMRPQTVTFVLDESTWAKKRNENVKCAYKSLADLESAEAYPQAGSRHMVTPPSGGTLSLVCCETTVGNLNIVAHHKWAPRGAQRFLDMVTSGYFNTTVPFMRCVKNFLCQFGLNSVPYKTHEFQSRLPDDPNWLPEGPLFRENEQHVKVRYHFFKWAVNVDLR